MNPTHQKTKKCVDCKNYLDLSAFGWSGDDNTCNGCYSTPSKCGAINPHEITDACTPKPADGFSEVLEKFENNFYGMEFGVGAGTYDGLKYLLKEAYKAGQQAQRKETLELINQAVEKEGMDTNFELSAHKLKVLCDLKSSLTKDLK